MTADHNNNGLDPQLARLLRDIAESGLPELQTLSPADARAAYLDGVKRLSQPVSEPVRTEDARFDAGSGPVGVRLYHPPRKPADAATLVVYFHGGGWCFGSLDTHDNVCRTLSARAACIVASVDYRLAPEHRFPQAVDDAIAAAHWAAEYACPAATRRRIAVAGDSAGGTLAAVAALAARDAGQPEIACQLLIYPATEMSMSYPSHRAFGDGYRLTRPLMVWSSLNYLRDGADLMDPRASPLLAGSHEGLPPAIVITAGFDPLRDEGAAYASKLEEAGVAVTYRCFENLSHGFITYTGAVAEAASALDEIALLLKQHR